MDHRRQSGDRLEELVDLLAERIATILEHRVLTLGLTATVSADESAGELADGRPAENGPRVNGRRGWPVDGWATVAEVGEYLRLSRTKVYDLINQGAIPSTLLGKARRIPWAALRMVEKKILERVDKG